MGDIVLPDREKLDRAVEMHQQDAVGIILRLAWRAGLSRKEIHALTWYQVDLEHRTLRLPDREVPLEEETAEALEWWHDRYGTRSSQVAYSPRTRAHLSVQSMSEMVRTALKRVGQTGVNITELRFDYLMRQIEEQGVPHALRVAGIGLTTYRSSIARKMRALGLEPEQDRKDAPPPHSAITDMAW